jgi:hypothetical protein
MSFPTKQAKQNHDNNYLNYLLLQIKNADKIVQHSQGVDLSMPPAVEEEDTRNLEEQLADEMKQKKQAYKNASKLFDKDTSRIDKLMSYLQENELLINFNQKFPQLFKDLKSKNSFVTVQQVSNMLEQLVEAIPDDEKDENGISDYLLNALGGDQGENVQGAPPDPSTDYDPYNTVQDMAEYAQSDDYEGPSWTDMLFGQGMKKTSKKTKMTKKEKELQKKLNALLKN